MEVPGSPPSWNASYRIITLRGHGSLKKMGAAERYQSDVTRLVQVKRPTDFQPEGQLYICYQMFLWRSMDADNILKLVNDGIAMGLGLNDSRFLPVVLSKSTGHKEPRLVISILDANVHKIEVT